ncbi:YARHG domain-containing protein [Alcanivorax sp. PA15-N-34]|uniref:YARHG domain-containing protein n=2 Tax=Alcanivorax sediminis TaxID=2663008 RepID=A0A6N7LPH8_9GAMM|nr:YARHG domain-containing protein [Alcanivorax sediminis]
MLGITMKVSQAAAGLLVCLGLVPLAQADVVCSMERCQDVGMQELDAYPAQNGFTPDAIFAIVENIIQLSGLTPNFQILETPRVGNAAATVMDGQRYLLYNRNWMDGLRGDEETWKLYGVVAHEVGHHLQGHTLDGLGSQPAKELEADEYAGFVLAAMGASLGDAQQLWQGLNAGASSTHPARRDRLVAVEKGWDRWQRQVAAIRGSSRPVAVPSSRDTQPASRSSASSPYLIADSARRVLSDSDVRSLDAQALRVARNEIFARHGYTFNSADLRRHFSRQPWYEPTGKQVSLNAVEQANVAFLLGRERVLENSGQSLMAMTSEDYLLPDSHRRKLSYADIDGLDKSTLRLARNEIFARHGYVFKSEDLNRYFKRYSWYKPHGGAVSLSGVEQYNVGFIKQYE